MRPYTGLLDGSNPSVTLATLGKAPQVLGRKVKIELVPALDKPGSILATDAALLRTHRKPPMLPPAA